MSVATLARMIGTEMVLSVEQGKLTVLVTVLDAKESWGKWSALVDDGNGGKAWVALDRLSAV